jgi:hypothetical protein
MAIQICSLSNCIPADIANRYFSGNLKDALSGKFKLPGFAAGCLVYVITLSLANFLAWRSIGFRLWRAGILPMASNDFHERQ